MSEKNITIKVEVPQSGVQITANLDCIFCQHHFTNKQKLVLHYTTNHNLILCNFCNICFGSQEDRLSHEFSSHLPIPCSYSGHLYGMCSQVFTEYNEDHISAHYEENHRARLCKFCDNVIEPLEEFPAHLAKKHVIINLDAVTQLNEICKFDKNFFVCLYCDKRKKIHEMVGHYVFYHNFSVKMMSKLLVRFPQIQIEGANPIPINKVEELEPPALNRFDDSSDNDDACQICNKEFSNVAPKRFHDVFCGGSTVCNVCEDTFENPNQLTEHKDSKHISILCKFGCKKTLKVDQLENHVKQIHDIEECILCGVVNSSNRISSHLKDQHNVDLQNYEQRKLYRVEGEEKVLCNFCNNDITGLMGDLTITIGHYQSMHDVSSEALLKYLNKNPILNRVARNDDPDSVEHYIKNFTVQQVPNVNEGTIIRDFDTNFVYCVGLENSDDEHEDICDPLVKPAEGESTTSNPPTFNHHDKKFECEFCGYKFQTRHFLYDHLKKKHDFKLIYANPRCSPCEINFATFQTFNKHLKRLHKTGKVVKKELKCPFCQNLEFGKKRDRENHIFKQHCEEIKTIPCSGEIFGCHTCQFCKQKFWTSQQKNSHQLTEHKNQLKDVLLICPIDNVEFVSKVYLQTHLKSHNVEFEAEKIIYKCFQCHFVYSEIEQMRDHMVKNHPEAEQNYCSLCRFRLPNEELIIEHLKEKHPSKVKLQEQYSCNICMKTYSKKSFAIVHYKQQHTGAIKKVFTRGFKCLLCGKEFRSKDDRKLHYVTEHKDEKIYKCGECPSSFRNKSSLCAHKLLHKDVVNICQYCEKTFSRRDSFKEHLLIHEGPKHKCKYCDKNFVQRSNLIRHERIHLNEKPYNCRFCEKTFSDKGACSSHEKVHTREEVSNCPYCEKTFSRKQKLRYHIRLHTQENLLKCEKCPKVFTENYSLRKHLESHARNNRCYKCNKLFKSSQVLQEHQESVHGLEFDEDGNLIPEKKMVQCSLCFSNEFPGKGMQQHLQQVHGLEETGESWMCFVNDDYEMKDDENEASTSTSMI